MGFYNIILEGQQAEEYKKKKAEETEKEDDDLHKRYNRHLSTLDRTLKGYNANGHYWKKDDNNEKHYYPASIRDIGNKNNGTIDDGAMKHYGPKNGGYYKHNPSKEDDRRDTHAAHVAQRYLPDNDCSYDEKLKSYEYLRDKDTINRHMRRHPDQWEGSKRIKTRSEACGIFGSVEFLNEAVDRVKLDVYGREFSLKVYFSQYKGEEITEQQEIAYERFIKNKKVDENSKDKVINYIENNYKKDLSDNDTKNIFKYLIPKTIFIPRQDGMKRSIILLCDFKFDIEHGIGILFENEKMTDIGLQDEFL